MGTYIRPVAGLLHPFRPFLINHFEPPTCPPFRVALSESNTDDEESPDVPEPFRVFSL